MAKPQFTKIVITDKEVQLSSIVKKIVEGVEDTTNQETRSGARPLPSFEAALEAFKPFLLEIIGAPKSWAEKTTVRGVSINKHEDGKRGCVITAVRVCPYGSAPIALNTPHLAERTDETKDSKTAWLVGMDDAIDVLCTEALKYHDGERAQGELFEAKPKRGKGAELELVGDVLARTGKGERAGAKS